MKDLYGKVKSNIDTSTFSSTNKPRKRKLEEEKANLITQTKNLGSIITLAGPNPLPNYKKYSTSMGKDSKYIAVEYDNNIYNRMCDELKGICGDIIPVCGGIESAINPLSTIGKDALSKVKRISVIDFDYCKTFDTAIIKTDLKSNLEKLIASKKLDKKSLWICYTFPQRPGPGHPSIKKSGDYKREIIDFTYNFNMDLFLSKYRNFSFKEIGYRDGTPMITFWFNFTN